MTAGVLGTLLAGIVLFQLSRERCFSLILPSICRVETAEKIVALSFDDGPTLQGVDATLPALQAAGAHATFFVVGSEARNRQALLQRLLAADMELGNHSWSHVRMVARSAGFYAAEVDRTAALIRAAGGNDHRLFRAPYGKKLFGLPWLLKQRGYRLVMADVVDPAATTPEEFARQVVSDVRPGSIILIHLMYSGNATGRAALPLILTELKRRGYRMVSVGELLARGRPTS